MSSGFFCLFVSSFGPYCDLDMPSLGSCIEELGPNISVFEGEAFGRSDGIIWALPFFMAN